MARILRDLVGRNPGAREDGYVRVPEIVQTNGRREAGSGQGRLELALDDGVSLPGFAPVEASTLVRKAAEPSIDTPRP
jgi:hypothetical protein